MGKSKSRILSKGKNLKYSFMTREMALDSVIKNITNKNEVMDTITLFGFTAEEILEAGAAYEDVLALGGMVQ